jgi:hypothetical protein
MPQIRTVIWLDPSSLKSSTMVRTPFKVKPHSLTLRSAEKAYATLQDCFLPAHNVRVPAQQVLAHSSAQYTLSLSLTPHAVYPDDPKPQSKPRLVKQLPLQISPGAIFDRFRQYGPIYRITLQQDLGYSHTIAIIEYVDS